MSELQTALAQSAIAPAAFAAKPRISADAFRNLTARLKKPDLVVPGITLVKLTPSVVKSPEFADVPASAIAGEAELDDSDNGFIIEIPERQLIRLDVPRGTPEAETFAPKPVSPEAFASENFAPEVVPPAALVAEAFSPKPVSPNEFAFESFAPSPFADEAPAPKSISPEVFAAEVFAPEPLSPEDFAVETFVVEPTVDEPVMVVVEAAASKVEPQLEGSFAENFTFVPEPGKEEPQAKLEETDDIVTKELAELAVQLELENIWRLLLAKPTSEDRTQYLREVVNYSVEEDESSKPAAEFDLSRIQPAAEEFDPAVATGAEAPELAPQVAEVLPVPEGQDLAELSRSLLDMMASGNAAGQPQERALAADTLLRLVPRLELKPLTKTC
jgi:hypothetical protein